MIFKWLVIHNFFRVKHLEIDLSSNGITYIYGRNGAGKSTIFAALCWALFGSVPGSPLRLGDDVVNPTEKHDCYVELHAQDNGQNIRIKRTRMEGPKHKDANLYVWLDGKEKTFDLRQKDVSDSTKYIASLIDRDYDTFVRQEYLAQEGVEPISRMKDAGIKQFFLQNILNIEWAQLALARAKNEKSRLEAIVSQKQGYREGAKRTMKLHAKRIGEYRGKIAVWKESLKTQQDELKEQIKEATELLDQAEKSNKDIQKKIDKLTRTQEREKTALQKKLNKLAVPEDYTDEIEKLEKQYRQATVEVSRAQDAGTRATERIERLDKKITDAENQIGQQCESCGTMITKKHIPFMIKELRADIETTAKEEEVKDKEAAEAKKRSESILRDLETYKDKRDAQKGLQDERTEVRVTLAQLENRQRREMDELEEELLDVDGVKNEIASLIEKQDETPTNPFADLLARELTDIKQAARDSKDVAEEIVGVRREIEGVEFWVKGFSGSGIQSYLLSQITPILNKYIAQYMGPLANNRIAARLHTVKQLKSGEWRENFHLEINNLDGGGSFHSLSGGERRRVDLAVSLAVGDFRRGLSHKPLQFMVLDEVTNFLDEIWETAFYKMIRDKFGKFSTFVITHKPIERTLYDREWYVSKQSGETVLEVRK